MPRAHLARLHLRLCAGHWLGRLVMVALQSEELSARCDEVVAPR